MLCAARLACCSRGAGNAGFPWRSADLIADSAPAGRAELRPGAICSQAEGGVRCVPGLAADP